MSSGGSSNAPPVRCVHYVGFRDDRYWNAVRVFGGPRIIHRRWDRRALREIGPEDVVVFADGDETQAFAEHASDDIDERWLSQAVAVEREGRRAGAVPCR